VPCRAVPRVGGPGGYVQCKHLLGWRWLMRRHWLV